jgi:hypothetical protein
VRVKEAVRQYVHEAAISAIDSNNLHFLSELRTICTVFIEIVGLSDDLDRGQLARPQQVIQSNLIQFNSILSFAPFAHCLSLFSCTRPGD